MKKLFSAVTSAVMGITTLTSVFASAFSVSAAGGLSTEQPIAMNGTIDETANKNSSSSIDFTWDYNGEDSYKAKAGEKVEATLMIDSHGTPVQAIDMGFVCDSPIAIDLIADSSPAFDNKGLVTNPGPAPAARSSDEQDYRRRNFRRFKR